MDGNSFLGVPIYIAAAALAAPVGRWLGVETVLGYPVAGTLLGPAVLGRVAEDRDGVMHFSEFGVVLMPVCLVAPRQNLQYGSLRDC